MESPHILELGGVVRDFTDCHKTIGWYTEHFELIPIDVQLRPDGNSGRWHP
ncbi:hypothetical protein [Streptomyces sp. NPDC051001]|uniref:hypothetical protein n=1 Tax=Streptomyces sp. NPDC051001 TaxID=3155795 RepID=UPI003417D32B